MKMMRWLVEIIVILIAVIFLHGPPAAWAAAATSPTTCGDEHPWDRLKNAYRIQILVITEEYMLVAVWYTRDQVQPVLVRIELSSPDRQTGSKTSHIISD